jgi:hypothetical protein
MRWLRGARTTRSIWMCPWDLEGREPEAVLDELEDIGLNAARLALSYHGGRMYLPRHRFRAVYEQHPGAVYFQAEPSRYARLRPAVSTLACETGTFLAAAARRRFPVLAWTVLCHNDHLGALAPDCCVENAFGDRYTYTLCPSHPDVQDYILALCADIAAQPGIAGLDIEALSYMGYQHHSPHDKRGVPLSPETTSLLSLCFCHDCRHSIGPEADELRSHVRRAVRSGVPVEWTTVVESRRKVLLGLLSRLRTVSDPAAIDLRVSPDACFHGGKTALSFEEIRPFVDAATVTFFGVPVESIRTQLSRISGTTLPVHGGFVFHHPDCRSEADLRERLEVLTAAELQGTSFYSYSMASDLQLGWLQNVLKGS